MKGNYLIVTLLLQAAVAMALQPSILPGRSSGNLPPDSVSETTTTRTDTIPPVAPPGRGQTNENDNITIIDTFTEPGVSTLPVESTPDNVLATRIQNELIREIPWYTASGRQINSQSGHVTIQGSVRTQAESQQVVNVIKRMAGVKSIRNNLTVEENGAIR